MPSDKTIICLSTILGIASFLGLALLARSRLSIWKQDNSAGSEESHCAVEMYDIEANKVEDDRKWQEDRVRAIRAQELARVNQQRIEYVRYPPAVVLRSV